MFSCQSISEIHMLVVGNFLIFDVHDSILCIQWKESAHFDFALLIVVGIFSKKMLEADIELDSPIFIFLGSLHFVFFTVFFVDFYSI